MRNGLILMTGLPITLGHKYLIDFGLNYLKYNGGGKLYVLLNSRSFEPVPGSERINALVNHFEKYVKQGNLIINECADDSVPQNPSEHSDFWNYWKRLIRIHTQNKRGDYVFASEKYGVDVANCLECEFIPCNQYRQIIKTSGTKVRTDPIKYFGEILPELQNYFRKTITLFGPESCGKTTMTKILSEQLNGYMVPEWAREYLETVGPEITDHRMYTITNGQYATQKTVSQNKDKPFIFQDTDLLSTIGYYKLWKQSYPDRIVNLFNDSRSDLYVVMNDKIAFEPDILRYGDGKRESDCAYWIDLLKQFNCAYFVVKNTDLEEQVKEIIEVCTDLFMNNTNMHKFIRT